MSSTFQTPPIASAAKSMDVKRDCPDTDTDTDTDTLRHRHRHRHRHRPVSYTHLRAHETEADL
eukprot:411319-Rhodomonas_salina.2